MHDRLVKLLSRQGRTVEFRKAERTVSVTGVGNGSNETDLIAKYPGAVKDAEGTVREVSFEAPVIPETDIPAVGKYELDSQPRCHRHRQ